MRVVDVGGWFQQLFAVDAATQASSKRTKSYQVGEDVQVKKMISFQDIRLSSKVKELKRSGCTDRKISSRCDRFNIVLGIQTCSRELTLQLFYVTVN